jgi:hypothetical protein
VYHLDLLGRAADAVGDDLGEPRLVTLAVRGRASEQRGRAGRVHPHLRALPVARLEAEAAGADHARRGEPADLDVGREADAAVHPLLAQLRLLSAERIHVEHLEQQVEGALVVARVVDHADRQLRRELILRDEVLAPQLEPVHAQLVGELVHAHLDHVRGLRPARSTDGVRGELGGEGADDVRLDRGEPVAAAHHEPAQAGDHRALDQQVRAEVLDDPRVDARERAVSLRAQLHVRDLVTPVVGGGHVLRTRLGPLDRPAQLPRSPAEQYLFGIAVELRAEAAAHLGSDHADLLLGHPELHRQQQPQDVRDLRGAPERQVARPVVG